MKAKAFPLLPAVLVSLLAGGLLGWLGRDYYSLRVSAKPKTYYAEHKRLHNYQYTSPLLECESYDHPFSAPVIKAQKRIKRLINKAIVEGKASKVSVYFRSLNSGEWFEVNGDKLYMPASLQKLPLMMAWLRRVEKNTSLLDSVFVCNNYSLTLSDYTFLREFAPGKELMGGKTYTLRQLLRYMIVHSDNKPLELLTGKSIDRAVYKMFEELELPPYKKHDRNKNPNLVKARDYGKYFQVLYNASYLSREMSEFALRLCSEGEFEIGLAAGLPDWVVLANKYGNKEITGPEEPTEKLLHDCGIVYLNSRPYIICVMTRGRDFYKQASVIRDISKTVFDILLKDLENKQGH